MKKVLPLIIIPAHNEESIIANTLNKLQSGVNKHYEVIVVCNGCNDNTSKIVSTFNGVQCENIETPSKALAIRHAETLKTNFPRLYLDADIALQVDDAKLMFSHMQKNKEAALYVPKSTVFTTSSDVMVQLYYRSWYETKFVQFLGYGSGVYALTEKGRNRFEQWPELISDDGFVRLHFKNEEIYILEDIYVDVLAPKTVWQLVRMKARSKYGNLQLKKIMPTHRLQSKSISKQLITTKGLQGLLLKLNYVLINFIASIWAYWMMYTNRFSWLKDISNH